MNRYYVLCVLFSVFFIISCTEPGRTTTIGAATGGAIGAGLGAIVGSQTGDPGSGLVIGGIAGAGTGALVGNALETQEKTLRAQDEAIERQQRIIEAQRREIRELKNGAQEEVVTTTRVQNRSVSGATEVRRTVQQTWTPSKGDHFSTTERERIAAAYKRAKSARNYATDEDKEIPSRIKNRDHGSAKAERLETRKMARSDRSQSSRVAVKTEPPKQAHASWSEREEAQAREEVRAIPERLPEESDDAPVQVVADVAPAAPQRKEMQSKEVVDTTSSARAVKEAPINEVQQVAAQQGGIKERELSPAKDTSLKGSFDWTEPGKEEVSPEVATSDSQSPLPEECTKADKEVRQADTARESADKLFHLRRALRLCPSRAEFHIKLGEVYQGLNRPDDAAFEYKEALKLDPGQIKAKEQLSLLGR